MAIEEMKFTPDQAFQIILKGMEAGQIKLPFHGALTAEELSVDVKKAIALHDYRPEDDVYSVAVKLARSARMDAIYLLTLFGSLTRGLTADDVQRVNEAFDRLMR